MKSLKFIAMACVVTLAFGCNKDKEAKPAEKANAKGSEEVAKKDTDKKPELKVVESADAEFANLKSNLDFCCVFFTLLAKLIK